MLGSGPGVTQSLQLRFVLIEPPVLFVIPFPTLSRPSSIPNIRLLTSFGTISRSRVRLIYPRFQIIRGDNKLYRAQYPSLLGVKSSGIHPEPPSPEMIRNKKISPQGAVGIRNVSSTHSIRKFVAEILQYLYKKIFLVEFLICISVTPTADKCVILKYNIIKLKDCTISALVSTRIFQHNTICLKKTIPNIHQCKKEGKYPKPFS